MLHCWRGVQVLILTDGNFHSWQRAKNPVWTLFFANRTFDKYQKYFRISVCILVQTFCKCQTACVICDIWHLRWSLMFEIFSCNARDVYINVLASSRHLAPFQECILQGKCKCLGTVLKIARNMASFSSGFFHIHPTWHWGAGCPARGERKIMTKSLILERKNLVITERRQKVQ